MKTGDSLSCQDQGGFLEEVTGRVTRNCCNLPANLDFALKELSRLAFLRYGEQKLMEDSPSGEEEVRKNVILWWY